MEKLLFRLKKLGICLLGALALGGLALAQEYRAVLQGQVTDATGGACPGVKIVLTNTETGVQVQTESNENGATCFPRWTPAPTR